MASSASVRKRFSVAAGSVENVARVVEQNTIIFARRHLVRGQAFRRRRACQVGFVGVAAYNTAIFQFHHVGAELTGPGQIFVC